MARHVWQANGLNCLSCIQARRLRSMSHNRFRTVFRYQSMQFGKLAPVLFRFRALRIGRTAENTGSIGKSLLFVLTVSVATERQRPALNRAAGKTNTRKTAKRTLRPALRTKRLRPSRPPGFFRFLPATRQYSWLRSSNAKCPIPVHPSF